MQNTRHFVIVAVLVIVVAYLTNMGLDAAHLFPIEASAQAGPIDWLFNLQIKAISFFFALIMVPLLYSLLIFRRRPGETGDGAHIEGNTSLEITWTVIPLILVIGLGIIGADNLSQVRRVDPAAMEVKVIGLQWDWRFEYPEGFTSDVLYLPKDKQVLLKMESLDVIHSFWVPEFRVKQDLVPGRVEELRITPTVIGEYKVRCAEICGASHAYMEKKVKVVSQEEYATWLTAQVAAAQAAAAANTGPDAGRGQKLYEQNCAVCHSIDGSIIRAPSWKGLYEEQVTLTDGSTVTADDAYLIESIKNPEAKIVAGFQAGMPNFGAILTDNQIADLVAFIKTLK